MNRGRALRELVVERLVVAADEIFALFERTLAEYEAEVLRKQEVQSLSVSAEVDPELDEEEDQPFGLKQEEHPTLEFLFAPFPLKTEDDSDKPSLLQDNRERDPLRDRCEAERPGCSLDLPSSNNHNHEEQASETDDSADWEKPDDCDGPESDSVHTRDSKTGENTRLFSLYVDSPCSNAAINFPKHKLLHSRKRRLSRLVLQKHSNAEGKLFRCVICGKTSANKSSFEKHLNTHAEDKPFRCPVCRKGFSQKCNLKRHMQTHTEERSFSCPECGLRLRQRHNMLRHISTVHRGEKPHGCPFCDKAFAQKSDFVIHMRTHTGEKPFKCAVCKKGFSVKGSLNRHLQKTHSAAP